MAKKKVRVKVIKKQKGAILHEDDAGDGGIVLKRQTDVTNWKKK